MTSILAIVSKTWFEKEARNIKGTILKVGDLYRINRYISTSAFLRPLSNGGSLFLVTARPQDRLWLVAVLENPAFQTNQWISQAINQIPITDISALTSQLRFSTGNGIHCDPGKLGMALQTPRQLTNNDVLLLRNAITPAIRPAAMNMPPAQNLTTPPPPINLPNPSTIPNPPAIANPLSPPKLSPVQTMAPQDYIPGYKTIIPWRGSPYPFKSPHRKKHMGGFFNELCRAVGDPGCTPNITSRRNTHPDIKNDPTFLNFSSKVVQMLHDFSYLGTYTDLQRMEQVFPLRYTFLLPARHGIVVLSAFSCNIAGEQGKVATYDQLEEYCHYENEMIFERRAEEPDSLFYHDNVFFKLERDYMNLFSISKPFRCLLDLPVQMVKGKTTKKDYIGNLRKLKMGARAVAQRTGILPEWKTVCTPTDVLLQTYHYLNTNGFLAALQFVRYLFRVSGKLREMLIVDDPANIDFEKIKSLTQRYLTAESVLKAVGKSVEKHKQTNVDDWLK